MDTDNLLRTKEYYQTLESALEKFQSKSAVISTVNVRLNA